MWVEMIGLAGFVLSATLLVYHHALYPLLLRKLARRSQQALPDIHPRGWQSVAGDQVLPSVEILMPAYNEAQHISEKLRNLAQLDYPRGRWQVVLLCDGCSDDTARLAAAVASEPECQDLPLVIRDFADNRGKIHRINQAMTQGRAELVLFTDVSALLPIDSLLALAAHFANHKVGAVSLGYHLMQPGSEGEQAYWRYQSAIKQQESQLGCVQGAHGAGWAMRRALFQALPADTINDDFILPMQVAARGYQVVYEPRLRALELECIDAVSEQRRRRRIAAGNTQQIGRLRALLNPRLGASAFMFFSGKVLRVLMPYCLLAMLVCNAMFLSLGLWAKLLFLAQIAGYGLFIAMNLLPQFPPHKLLRLINYLLLGHWANLIGSMRYLSGLQRGAWQRAKEV